MTVTKKTRFDLLDGIRGLAAIAVMVLHYTSHCGLLWLPGAGAAVDMFFVLSGFVLARSYGERILNGMTFGEFFTARVIRLFPLYLLGLALGVLATLSVVGTGEVAKAAAFGLFMIPYFNNISWPFAQEFVFGPIYPLNSPAWSLFFELFVNIVFFFALVRYRKSIHVGVVFILLAVYFLSCQRYNNAGWGIETFIGGFPRVIAGFYAGVWISDAQLWKSPSSPWMAVGLIVASFSAFLFAHKQIQMANVFFIIPALIICCANVDVSGAVQRACKLLGDLSYPLYVIHMPIFPLLYAIPAFRAMSPIPKLVLASAVALPIAFALISLDKKVRAAITARMAKTTAGVFVK